MPGSSPGMTGAFCGARQEVLRTLIPYSIFKQLKTTVIASAAKQSISPLEERMDCFASLAMTAL